MEKRSIVDAEIVASNLRGSDHSCNVIFTCFCKFYLFIFPILRDCTLVKCHCGIFIKLACKLNNQATVQNLASEPNLASVPNLKDVSGHKAIKIKKLRNLFKLNVMKAKLKQTTTVANYRPTTHTRKMRQKI